MITRKTKSSETKRFTIEERNTMKLDAQWIVGFVDGEGCFFVNVSQKPPHTSQTLECSTFPSVPSVPLQKADYYVKLQFQVKQHDSNIHVLYALKSYFGCGHVYRKQNGCSVYEVSKGKHLKERIVPFFEKHKLKTRKRVNFEKFRYIQLLIERKEHLTREGMNCIRQIKSTMNQYVSINTNI